MAVIRGGRKTDKPKGSCRCKRQLVSAKLRAGLVNDAAGRWVPFCKARVPQQYWTSMQEASQWRSERNQVARSKRDRCNGSRAFSA
jgi:hypothetical protein